MKTPDNNGNERARPGRTTPATPVSTASWKLTWQDYLGMIREYWYLGAVLGVIAAGAWTYNAYQAIPLYRSSATVLFEITQDRVLNIEEVRDTSIRRAPDTILRSHMADLRSSTFRNKVIQSLSSDERELIIADYRDEENPEPSVHGVIAGANNIRQLNANIFAVEFHHRNPEAAQLLANRFTQEFDRELSSRGREGSDSAIRFLRSQSEEHRLRVERGELALQRYRKDRDLISLEESQNLVLERLKTVSGSLNTANVELLDYETRVRQLDELIAADGDPVRLPFIAQHGNVAQRVEEKRRLEAERDLLSLRYGARHPSMVANKTALEVANRQLQDGVAFAVSSLREQYASQKQKVETLKRALAEAERDALELDQAAIDYNVLRRKLAADQQMFQQVHQRLNEAIISSQMANTNMRIVDPAFRPGSPFSPDTSKIVPTALGIFLLLTLSVPVGYGVLRGRLKTSHEVESYIGKVFLGVVHRFSRRKHKDLGRLVIDKTNPVALEQFRAIYSQLLIQKGSDDRHTYVVSSLIPCEGKSFVTSNLASTFCRHHHRVLVIDGDLRRPTLHKQFGVDNARGVIKWYNEHESDDDEINFSNLGLIPLADNLDFIPAGGYTNEPTEIIQSETFVRLMDYLKTVYDVVIIDTPPAGVFSDALCFAEFCDKFVLVVHPNKHPRSVVRSVVRQLEQSGTLVAGIIFNQLSKRKSKQLGTKYYHYAKYASKYYTVPEDAEEQESEEKAGEAARKS
ncbi:MAG: polysaccharide biosynthesis tyrosine autokinase [Opitutales bacterium]|nr:polysaccharide biosynthesis tyrosine autokinase [Opitutales bacterium]